MPKALSATTSWAVGRGVNASSVRDSSPSAIGWFNATERSLARRRARVAWGVRLFFSRGNSWATVGLLLRLRSDVGGDHGGSEDVRITTGLVKDIILSSMKFYILII